jgi:hypothetical protein
MSTQSPLINPDENENLSYVGNSNNINSNQLSSNTLANVNYVNNVVAIANTGTLTFTGSNYISGTHYINSPSSSKQVPLDEYITEIFKKELYKFMVDYNSDIPNYLYDNGDGVFSEEELMNIKLHMINQKIDND